MTTNVIGPARCPLCSGTARLSLAKTGLVVLTMNCCNAQLFARSDRSDTLMRGLLLPPERTDATAAPGDAGQVVPDPEPVRAIPVRTDTPAPKSAAIAVPAPSSFKGLTPDAAVPAPSVFGGLIKW